MPRSATAFVCWLALLIAPTVPRPIEAQEQGAQPHVFRTGIDVVQLDVTVLDRHRRPVQGLTAADFTVLEDGNPRPIVAFTSVTLTPPAGVAPTGLATIAPDVVANDLPDGRLVVILLDQSTRLGAPVVMARQIAHAAVDALGPGDLAAVIYTNHGRSQNFTADRAVLKAAINNSALGMNEPGDGALPTDLRGECPCGICSLDTITAVADALAEEPQRRKTLLFIGESIPIGFEPGPRTCDTYTASERMLRAAQAANLTIHALDPNGLEVTSVQASTNFRSEGQSGAAAAKEQANRSQLLHRHGTLRTLADETGGRAVLNTNAPTDSIRGILNETGSYYLIAFQPPERRPDGRFHRVTVRVNRPDVEVRTRRGYFAPRDGARPAPAAAAEGSLEDLTRGLLPRRGLPLLLSAAPFAAPEGTGATIVLALGVGQLPDGPSMDDAVDEPRLEQVEILASAYNAGARGADWHRQRFDVLLGGPRNDRSAYEALSRIDVEPGRRYEVRVGARHGSSRHAGTVHTYIEVPDFAREPVSLSGIVLHDPQAIHATPASVLDDFVPDVPTTRRLFTADDEVTAFLRVYQRRSRPAAPVQLVFRISNGALDPVWSHGWTVAVEDFDATHSAGARVQLPLRDLGPGDYLLSVEARRDTTAVRRDVRFALR